MRTAILRLGILLTLAALGTSAATAQTELYFATGVDSTGRALAQSNADGHVLIESPQYPRGLWLHLVDEARDALAGIQVEYQGRADSLVAIHCVDPTEGVRETMIWTRPDGVPLSLILKPSESTDLPTGVAPIDWQIDPSVEFLLEPVEEIWLIGWEEVAAFLRKRWQGQTGRVAIRLHVSTSFAVELDDPKALDQLMASLQHSYQPSEAPLGEVTPLEVRVFKGSFRLLEGLILSISLFEDAALEAAVRKALDQPQGRLTPEDIVSLTKLRSNSRGIDSLVGLEHFTALQRLELDYNAITDLTPLSQLKNLHFLNLEDNQITDLTPLSQLENLHTLWLHGNQITDITPLNQLDDLTSLYLDNNQIADITPLSQLKNLHLLNLVYNQIKDLAPLVANAGLGEGDRVYVKNNPLNDQARNEYIPALKARGVRVSY